MSRKGCSPDNAACEGFFGRLKNELFYSRDWLARGGWQEFHLGKLGDEIAADLAANGSYVTREDIANFKPECP